MRPPLDLDDPRLEDAALSLGLRLLVLFGSYGGSGVAPRRDSDVDLAYLLSPAEPGATRLSILDVHAALAPLFPDHSVDLAALHTADPLFRWEVMERGVLLYGDIDDFLEYRAFAYRDFTDSADLRALERALSSRKLQRLDELLSASA